MHVDSNNFDFYNKFSIFGSLCSATSEQGILFNFMIFFSGKIFTMYVIKPSFGMHELSSSLAMKTYKIY